METIEVHSGYTSEIDGLGKDSKLKFHKTFDNAVKRIIKNSSSFSRKPWGGLSEGVVFERHEFEICEVKYIIYNGNRIIIDNVKVFCYHKDWGDSIDKVHVDKYNAIDKVKAGISRRWKWCWNNVENKQGVPRKLRRNE